MLDAAVWGHGFYYGNFGALSSQRSLAGSASHFQWPSYLLQGGQSNGIGLCSRVMGTLKDIFPCLLLPAFTASMPCLQLAMKDSVMV